MTDTTYRQRQHLARLLTMLAASLVITIWLLVQVVGWAMRTPDPPSSANNNSSKTSFSSIFNEAKSEINRGSANAIQFWNDLQEQLRTNQSFAEYVKSKTTNSNP